MLVMTNLNLSCSRAKVYDITYNKQADFSSALKGGGVCENYSKVETGAVPKSRSEETDGLGSTPFSLIYVLSRALQSRAYCSLKGSTPLRALIMGSPRG